MKVRILMKQGPSIQPREPGLAAHPDANVVPMEEIAGTAAEVLGPAAVLAAVMALWRIGADLHVTGPFFLTEGVMSHWQIWFVIAAALQVKGVWLRRWSRRAAAHHQMSSQPMGMPGGASAARGKEGAFGSFSKPSIRRIASFR